MKGGTNNLLKRKTQNGQLCQSIQNKSSFS